MWFWLIFIGGFFKSAHSLIERVILKDRGDSPALAFILQLLGAVMVIPLFFLGLKFPREILPYFVLLMVGVIDTLAFFLMMESLRLLEVSLRTIIAQIRIFFVLVFSSLFLGESLNFAKFFGSVLIFLGIALAVFRKQKVSWFREKFWEVFRREGERSTGVFLTLATAFVTAIELLGWKYLLGKFAVSFTLFGVSLISCFLFAIAVKNLKERVLEFIRKKGRLIFMDGFLANVSWILFFWATSLVEASKTLPVYQGFTVLTVLGGIIFLNERGRLWQKILGGILTAIGVILVKGS